MTENEKAMQEIVREYWELRAMNERRADHELPGERLVRVEEKLDHLIAVIEGNGAPGLLVRVGELENHRASAIGAFKMIGVGVGVIGLVLAFFGLLHTLRILR